MKCKLLKFDNNSPRQLFVHVFPCMTFPSNTATGSSMTPSVSIGPNESKHRQDTIRTRANYN